MKTKLTFFIIISIFSIILTACPSSEQPKTNNTNTQNTAINKPVSNSNQITVPTPKPETAMTNNAPTLAPVVASYYDALKKKDDAGVRKVLSAEFIKSLEADMKDEGKNSLVEFILELDKIPEKPVEVRNEKIEGDKATAELKGGMNVNWTTYIFRKENGEWKMTNEFPDVNEVKSSSTTNTAK